MLLWLFSLPHLIPKISSLSSKETANTYYARYSSHFLKILPRFLGCLQSLLFPNLLTFCRLLLWLKKNLKLQKITLLSVLAPFAMATSNIVHAVIASCQPFTQPFFFLVFATLLVFPRILLSFINLNLAPTLNHSIFVLSLLL